MTRLIVNSDDYGRSANVSRGIRHAHLNGIVSSTTCMMNMPTIIEDLASALEMTPHLGMGVHLVLTAGAPLLPASQVPSLVTPAGMFHKLQGFTEGLAQINPADAKPEWRAQIERFISATGQQPTHLDSHHHSSYFTEGLFRAMLELAAEYGCAIRLPKANEGVVDWAGLPPEVVALIPDYASRLLAEFQPPRPDAFYATFYDETATTEEMLRILNALPAGGAYEVMVHPGYSDPELIAGTIYAVQRDRELAILTSREIVSAVREKNLQLITFRELYA
jgi:hypothetical protein